MREEGGRRREQRGGTRPLQSTTSVRVPVFYAQHSSSFRYISAILYIWLVLFSASKHQYRHSAQSVQWTRSSTLELPLRTFGAKYVLPSTVYRLPLLKCRRFPRPHPSPASETAILLKLHFLTPTPSIHSFNYIIFPSPCCVDIAALLIIHLYSHCIIAIIVAVTFFPPAGLSITPQTPHPSHSRSSRPQHQP